MPEGGTGDDEVTSDKMVRQIQPERSRIGEPSSTILVAQGRGSTVSTLPQQTGANHLQINDTSDLAHSQPCETLAQGNVI